VGLQHGSFTSGARAMLTRREQLAAGKPTNVCAILATGFVFFTEVGSLCKTELLHKS